MKKFIATCLLTLTSSLCLAQNYTLMTTEPSKVAEGEKSIENFFAEIATEVFSRSGLSMNIKEGHWIRNQKKVSTAAAKEKLLIIPLTRTEEREDLYDWIVPISSYKLQFITTDKTIDINNIDALKNIPICAYRESPAEYKLRDIGFTDIQAKVQEQICYKNLSKNKVKLMLAHGKLAAIQGFKNINKDPEKLIYGKSFPKETVYLASTKKAVTKEDQKKLNDAFTAIKEDGTYAKIYATY